VDTRLFFCNIHVYFLRGTEQGRRGGRGRGVGAGQSANIMYKMFSVECVLYGTRVSQEHGTILLNQRDDFADFVDPLGCEGD